jgi:4-amino-4-deoxy-L-arabinose transferase-like glycosyltransferase
MNKTYSFLKTILGRTALKNGSTQWYLLAIIFVSLILRVNFCTDMFLHEWDERYHALVAKHLIDHPLKPTLYETPYHDYDHNDWTANHIWLSKPPVPLWFMALSIKCFGLHEFSVRVPSLIFSTLSILVLFLIAKKLFTTRIALVSSALWGVHGLITDLVSGRLSSDGVETCFLFFVLFGMYHVFRIDQYKLKWFNYTTIGFVMGFAIMCKWQPALIILVVLFVYHFEKKTIVSHLFGCLLCLLSSACIVLPWIVYILNSFPMEARSFLTSLFTPFHNNSLNPDGKWYSYLTDFGNFFGYTTYLIMVMVLFQLFKSRNHILITLLVWVILPLLIFSCAEVKRGTYLFISAGGVFMLVGWACSHEMAHTNLMGKSLRILGICSVILILGYSLDRMNLFKRRIYGMEWSDKIKNAQYQKGDVIYDEPHYIELMFYHDVTAYPYSKP